MTFPMLVDEQQQYGRAYEGIGLPTSVIVGRDGHVVTRHRRRDDAGADARRRRAGARAIVSARIAARASRRSSSRSSPRRTCIRRRRCTTPGSTRSRWRSGSSSCIAYANGARRGSDGVGGKTAAARDGGRADRRRRRARVGIARARHGARHRHAGHRRARPRARRRGVFRRRRRGHDRARVGGRGPAAQERERDRARPVDAPRDGRVARVSRPASRGVRRSVRRARRAPHRHPADEPVVFVAGAAVSAAPAHRRARRAVRHVLDARTPPRRARAVLHAARPRAVQPREPDTKAPALVLTVADEAGKPLGITLAAAARRHRRRHSRARDDRCVSCLAVASAPPTWALVPARVSFRARLRVERVSVQAT